LEKSFSLNADELAIPYNNENVNFKAFFDSENFKIENFKRIDENVGNEATTVAITTLENRASTMFIKSSTLIFTIFTTFLVLFVI
jgi:hypothetical protein